LRRDRIGNLRKGGRRRNHRVGDARQRLNSGRNAAPRIDEGTPLADVHAFVDANDPDLGDPVVAGDGAGRFQIDEGDGWREHDSLA
jgi:hypothetical protein